MISTVLFTGIVPRITLPSSGPILWVLTGGFLMEIVTGRTSLGVEKDLKMSVVNDVQLHLEATEPRRQVLWGVTVSLGIKPGLWCT